jgi:HSP20 family molecular chaperone IbpA
MWKNSRSSDQWAAAAAETPGIPTRRPWHAHCEKFHRVERQYGQFLRRFTLPTEVDAAKVRAEFKDGVLNARLPKSISTNPWSVEIKVA